MLSGSSVIVHSEWEKEIYFIDPEEEIELNEEKEITEAERELYEEEPRPDPGYAQNDTTCD